MSARGAANWNRDEWEEHGFSYIYGHGKTCLKLHIAETKKADFGNEFQVKTRSY